MNNNPKNFTNTEDTSMKTQNTLNSENRVKKQTHKKSKLPFAIVAIIFILTAGFIVYKIIVIPENVAGIIKKGFNPKIDIRNISYNSINEIKKDPKLVVMTAEINVAIERSSEKSILWGKLKLGTTVVEIKVPENKVQYILPTNSINREDFKWNEYRRELTIYIPKPVLDTDIIEIQSDPNKISIRKDIGWGRLKGYSGDFLENNIKSNLRIKVIETAQNDLLIDRACKNAAICIKNIIKNSLKNQVDPVSLIVKFKDDHYQIENNINNKLGNLSIRSEKFK
jgi:hypothetical protein